MGIIKNRWTIKESFTGLRMGARFGLAAWALTLVTTMAVTACQTASTESAYKKEVLKLQTVDLVSEDSRCSNHFKLIDFPPSATRLAGQMIELACVEFSMITGKSYEEVVNSLKGHTVLVKAHANDEVCSVSNIHTCSVSKLESPFSIILLDSRFEESFSALRHEAFHILLTKSGVNGQQAHHLIMRKFGICNMIYAGNGSHLCGDITDESVNILSR
jgi:hypothetical protein